VSWLALKPSYEDQFFSVIRVDVWNDDKQLSRIIIARKQGF
jgi:hypothetical protein